MGSEEAASPSGARLEGIMGLGLWQVHLGRDGGRLMTKKELDAAVARNEIGMETLVRQPGGFIWTTAGAATGLAAPPETPPEPPPDSVIEVCSSETEVARAAAPAIAKAEPKVDVKRKSNAKIDAAFTNDELAIARPRGLVLQLVVVATAAFIGGVLLAGRYLPRAHAIPSATTAAAQSNAPAAPAVAPTPPCPESPAPRVAMATPTPVVAAPTPVVHAITPPPSRAAALLAALPPPAAKPVQIAQPMTGTTVQPQPSKATIAVPKKTIAHEPAPPPRAARSSPQTKGRRAMPSHAPAAAHHAAPHLLTKPKR